MLAFEGYWVVGSSGLIIARSACRGFGHRVPRPIRSTGKGCCILKNRREEDLLADLQASLGLRHGGEQALPLARGLRRGPAPYSRRKAKLSLEGT
jgi:hypothetical protein